jgi:hypothetical protein
MTRIYFLGFVLLELRRQADCLWRDWRHMEWGFCRSPGVAQFPAGHVLLSGDGVFSWERWTGDERADLEMA